MYDEPGGLIEDGIVDVPDEAVRTEVALGHQIFCMTNDQGSEREPDSTY